VNRLVLTFGLTAMDLCWVYPWSVLLGVWADPSHGAPLLSAVSVFALVFLAALTAQVLGRRALTSRAARVSGGALALVAAIVAVRVDQYPSAVGLEWFGALVGAAAVAIGQLTAPVLAFAVALYLWWRGVRLGQQTPSFAEVDSAFRWGIGRLVAFGLVMAILSRPGALPGIEAQTTPFVVGFFFISLLSLALGRLESLRTRRRALSINTQWFGVLVLVAGAVVLVALVVGQILSFDLLGVVTRPVFDVLGQVLLLALYAIVIPLAYVIEWLIYLVLSLIQTDPSRLPPELPQPSAVNNLLERFFSQLVPPEVLLALKAAGAAVVLGIALLIVARTLSRWRPSSADAEVTNEERDSVWNGARMRALLLAWLKRLLRRGGRGDAALGSPFSPAMAFGSTVHLSSVRAVYVELLRLGASAGARREVATTPMEHARALTRALDPDQNVTDLTEAYHRARYGELDASTAEVAGLRNELEALHPKGAVD
jgi:Domain of unknown function (DUF4129)